MPGHWARNCPLPQKKTNQGNVHQGYAHFTTIEEIPAGEVVVVGKFLINNYPVVVLFDSGASHSFVSSSFAYKNNLKVTTIDKGGYCISAARNNITINQVVMGTNIEIRDACILPIL
jgi:hypothetical protein